MIHRHVVLAVSLMAGVLADFAHPVHATSLHTRGAPSLAGTWAMEGTGPAGLVNTGGRIAIVLLRQHGHTLTLTLQSGGRRYGAAGTYSWTSHNMGVRWRMPAAGLVRFSGIVQAGNTRIIGQWADSHGDDGGAILVRAMQ